MSERYVVTGTLPSARTGALDEAAPPAATRVRVVVAPPAAASQRPYAEAAAIRARQRQRGHQPRSRAAVDATLLEERASWET